MLHLNTAVDVVNSLSPFILSRKETFAPLHRDINYFSKLSLYVLETMLYYCVLFLQLFSEFSSPQRYSTTTMVSRNSYCQAQLHTHTTEAGQNKLNWVFRNRNNKLELFETVPNRYFKQNMTTGAESRLRLLDC